MTSRQKLNRRKRQEIIHGLGVIVLALYAAAGLIMSALLNYTI